jgi:hypothetical protein
MTTRVRIRGVMTNLDFAGGSLPSGRQSGDEVTAIPFGASAGVRPDPQARRPPATG